jgi:hypothetical protein
MKVYVKAIVMSIFVIVSLKQWRYGGERGTVAGALFVDVRVVISVYV